MVLFLCGFICFGVLFLFSRPAMLVSRFFFVILLQFTAGTCRNGLDMLVSSLVFMCLLQFTEGTCRNGPAMFVSRLFLVCLLSPTSLD